MLHKSLILILFLSFGNFLSAQTYLISSYNNQTINTCSGSFYDSGGPSGGYAANQTYVVTFAPNSSGYANVSFTSFSVSIGDMLEVFDGATVNAPLIGIYNNGNSPVGQVIRASLFNIGGKLTFRWTSVNTGAGWAATFSCGVPCQDFNAIITSSTPQFTIDSGIYFIDICPGDSVSLTASASFPYNNFYYHQDINTTDFAWDFGGGAIVNGQNVSSVFNNVQGYNAFIIATDTNGCRASQNTEVRIRVSTPPVFAGTDIVDHTICENDSTQLNGYVKPTHWEIIPSLSVAGTTYLPDGSGVSYTSNLVFSGFNPGQTIQQVSDIIRVFAEIEHSYMGDLNIVIKCPNNSSVTLKSYPGGGSTFFGEPIDNNAQPVPGIGYMYYWQPNGTTTMIATVGTYSHTFTDVLGTTYSSHAFLPPSTAYPALSTALAPFPQVIYTPETPFTNFIGCPLNGAWSITVTDNLMIDNGFIFSWGLDFNPSVMPVAWGYTPLIDSSYWNYGFGDTTTYLALVPGINNLTYSMQDGAGCVYDTTIDILVNPAPGIDLGNDTSICIYDDIVLNSGNAIPGTVFNWSNGGSSSTNSVTVNTTQSYSLTATSNYGCVQEDSILVVANPLPHIIISDDTLICIGTEAFLSASGGDIYVWSNGANNANIQVAPLSSNTFFVTVTDSNSCVSDSSVFVTVAPLPTIKTSNDTTICENTDVNLWASGGNIYKWSNGVQQADQNVSPVDDQIYTVVVTDNNTCVDSAEVEVTILSLPIAKAMSDYDTLCRGGTVTLSAQGGMSYLWNNGSISSSWSDIPKEPITYHLLAINTQNGTNCYDTASVFVYVEHCALYIPSGFTPNGDGLNDKFGPIGIVSDNAFYEFIIYDRWGAQVFYTNNKYEQWDGRKDYQNVIGGVYTYVIRVSEKSIQPYQLTGTVTLIR